MKGISRTLNNGVCILKLLEQKYFSNSRVLFQENLQAAEAESEGGLIIIDLNSAALITSGPLGALRACHRRLQARGGRIVAAGGGEFAVKVLSFAANFIDHYPSVEAAMADIAPDLRKETDL